jgi:hypothetical protein
MYSRKLSADQLDLVAGWTVQACHAYGPGLCDVLEKHQKMLMDHYGDEFDRAFTYSTLVHTNYNRTELPI